MSLERTMTTGPSIFKPSDLDALLARIRALRPDAPRLWGKMDAAQMLAHCQISLRLALGEHKVKRVLIGYLFGGLAKKSLATRPQFRHNLPTDTSFVFRDPRDFTVEQAQLVETLERLGRGGSAKLTTEPHPFFGHLTVAEWDMLVWKHLDHHLRQFGA